MIEVVAKLKGYTTEYRGSSNFTKCRIDVDLQTAEGQSEIPLQFVANGTEGDRVNAILGESPENILVRIGARPVFRRYQESTYFDLEVVDLELLGNVGTISSNFRFQGFINDLEEKTSERGKGNNTFYVGHLRMVAFERDGAVVDPLINMLVNADAVEAWRASQGKYTLVTGTMSGNRNAKNPKYVYPRFVAQGVHGSIVTPSWLKEFAPGAVAPVSEPEVAAVPF